MFSIRRFGVACGVVGMAIAAPAAVSAQGDLRPEKGLFEKDFSGFASFSPTDMSVNAFGNHFFSRSLALTATAGFSHFDNGEGTTTSESIEAGLLASPYQLSNSLGLFGSAQVGFSHFPGQSEVIYDLYAGVRYAPSRNGTVYAGLSYSGFKGGHEWEIGASLMPAVRPDDRGKFLQAQKGLLEIGFNTAYFFDSKEFDLSGRIAPYLTNRIQVGADVNFSHVSGFTFTDLTGWATMDIPLGAPGRLTPFFGGLVGYTKSTDSNGFMNFGPQAGLRYSCSPRTAVSLAGAYRIYSGSGPDNAFGLNLMSSVYFGK